MIAAQLRRILVCSVSAHAKANDSTELKVEMEEASRDYLPPTRLRAAARATLFPINCAGLGTGA